jgi:hypothetical protein
MAALPSLGMALFKLLRRGAFVFAFLTVLSGSAAAQHAAPEINTAEDLDRIVRQTFASDRVTRLTAIRQLAARGETVMVPALIQTLRYLSPDEETLVWGLQQLTGEDA